MDNNYTYTSPLIYVLAFVMALYMFTFPFISYPYVTDQGPTWLGLDVSWQMMLNYSNNHDLVWGKDIIYTYGPLGFLATRFAWGVSRWFFLAFDLMLMVNFFYVFKDFLKASISKTLGALILLAAMLLMQTDHGSDLSWVLLFLIFFWIYKTFTQPSARSFIMLIILTVLSFYVKMNTGLIGICVLVAHLALLYFSERLSIRTAFIILFSLIGSIYLSSLLLHVHLPGYIKGAFEIIKGYNDTMHLNNNEIRHEQNVQLLYNMMKYLIIIYFIYILLKGKFIQFFFLGLCVGYIILIKKQAILRGDVQHLSEFYCYGPLVLILGNFLYFRNNTQKIFSAAILFIFTIALFFKTEHGRKIDELFAFRFSNIGNYVKQFKDSKQPEYLINKDKRYIPAAILNKIDDSTIDVFPWDAEYLIENKLNYSPRPIFQSFSAYTRYLQEVNYNHYLKNAPEYVLYDYDAIDNRYPANDEPLLTLFLLKNYTLSDTFTSNSRLRSLLQKNTGTGKLNVDKKGERKIKLTGNIPVLPGTNFIRANVSYNFKGRKTAFTSRPPKIDIQFTTESGSTHVYRTSIELLKGGVITEKLITSHTDFLSLLSQNDFLNKITHINLLCEQGYFDDELVVEYYNIK